MKCDKVNLVLSKYGAITPTWARAKGRILAQIRKEERSPWVSSASQPKPIQIKGQHSSCATLNKTDDNNGPCVLW